MTKRLDGKVAIVTGAAGGIGRSLSEVLGERGCRVILADVNDAQLADTVSALQTDGVEAEGTRVDVSNPDDVERLVLDTHRAHGRIDYLFNNAGINVFGEVLDTSLDDWARLIDVNLRGVIHGVHFTYPIMCEQGFGHIVNTASVAGIAPTPAEAAYAATKHAVVGLSSALRIEAAAHGVGVSVVCPGGVDTPILTTSKHVKFDADAILELSPEKPLPPRRVAERIVRDVERGRFFIVISKTANAFWHVYRAAPERSLSIGELVMRKIRAIKRQA